MSEGQLILGFVVDGQPSFPCGCVTDDCCLYPWPGLSPDYFYPHTDLPETVLVNGDTFTLDPSTYIYTGATGIIQISEIYGAWEFVPTEGGLEITSPCLIGTYRATPFGPVVVEDEFADTYLIDGYDTVVTRNALLSNLLLWPEGTPLTFIANKCTWASASSGTDTRWIIWYGTAQDLLISFSTGPNTYGFNMAQFVYDFDTGFWRGNGGQKDPDQSSPIGSYDGSPVFEVTVS